MPKRNHLGAERVVRPEVPRVRAAIDTTAISSVFMSMVFFLFAIMMPTWQGLDVGLPRIMPGSLEAYTSQVVLEITADRAITLNHNAVTLPELEGKLREVLSTRRDKTVYVIGAGVLRYGDVVPLIDAAHGAGARRVGVITERMLEIAAAARSAR